MQPGTIIALAEDRIAELRCEAGRLRRAIGAAPSSRARFVALLRRRAARR